MLLYAGNLTEAELPKRRLVRLLGWMFVVTVGGGLLGMFAGTFEFTSPVEMLLSSDVRDKGFVQSLVHPYAAQIHDILGDHRPRPAAPWGYTNTWGNNFCLLVVWFCAAAFAADDPPPHQADRRRHARGLGGAGHRVAQPRPLDRPRRRRRLRRRPARVRRPALGDRRAWSPRSLALGLALAVTPLGDVVTARLDNGKSNGVRSFLVDRALAGAAESPLIGFGSTRDTIGGRHSITVGESYDCERCGNFTIGGNGQFWQLLFAHGLLGTLGYLGFFGYGIWRFRRDRGPIGIAGGAALIGTFAAMLWYNALVTPLAFMFLAYALLWRNAVERTEGSAA